MDSLAVLTRPEGRNDALAARLNARGIATLTLPALSIEPITNGFSEPPLPGDYDLIVFVSGHAVSAYFEMLACKLWTETWPPDTLLATVGRSSAAPLYQKAFIPQKNIYHPAADDPRHDSEALWQSLSRIVPLPRRVLIVRGETGREWLGQKLEQAGAQVRRYCVYRRKPAIWTESQVISIRAALQSGRPLVCLLTSAESVAAVHANIDRLGLYAFWDRAVFVAIHERVASYLTAMLVAASGKVCVPVVKVCSPDDDAIFQAIVLTTAL